MTSSVSGSGGFAPGPYSNFYNDPNFMQNELQTLGTQIQQQDAEWKESQQEMVQDLPSLQDAPQL